jgi:D-alanine-D-alanine ligase
MRVLVLYNEASHDATIDEQDVLVQRDAVQRALNQLGHETSVLACTLDFDKARSNIRAQHPDVVFNLVEALGGTDRLAPMATLLLDSLGIPYTGASTEALLATNNKLVAKRRLLQAGLPTPAWFVNQWQGKSTAGGDGAFRTIVKAVWEHASFGMDDNAVAAVTSENELRNVLAAREAATGHLHFAEQYIAGREFNLTVLAGANGPEVLQPVEIDFSAFPDDKPHIVGYRAKWDAGSFEYHHTPRRFEFEPHEATLLDHLSALARECWDEFELSGYARVDFRVDQADAPWILEVNTNPCLSPDAGFAAAVANAGLTYERAVERILADAVGRLPAPGALMAP